MKTPVELSDRPVVHFKNRRAAGTAFLLPLLLALPAVVQAQFIYTITNGTVIITGYTGGGAVTIPGVINGLPVTTIGALAFRNQYFITSVTIPDSVTGIEWGAFDHCTGMTSAAMGNSITNIGYVAFQNCHLTSITIRASVISIGKGSLNSCTNLTAITVEALNSAYSSVDGVLFDKRQATLVQCPGGKVGNYAIPNGVTRIEDWAFHGCPSLTNAMIPNSVTNIGQGAFEYCGLTSLRIPNSLISIETEAFAACWRLTKITIPSNITSIGQLAFYECTSLTNVTIANSVTNLGPLAFSRCYGLGGVYFQGNAPGVDIFVFDGDSNATVYYLPGTTGWGTAFGGRPTALWPPPTIQTSPQTQTAEAGAAVRLRVDASSLLPLSYVWYFNQANPTGCTTNCELYLPNVQFSQSGVYTVVVTNASGAVSSAPAMLQVIAPVERRPVPGVKVTGETGVLVNLDYANSLSPAPSWTTLGSVSLTGTSQYWFDLIQPLLPQRFYRAWQTGTPSVIPSLDLHMVPAITLTGDIGDTLRLDYINQFGPIDAWVNLATVTLTNTTQLYFDTSSIGQPPRLWRIVPVP